MYLVTGSFIIKQDHLQQAKSIMQKIVEVGRTEPGIVRYTFYPDPIEPLRYFLFEEWETRELHDKHFEGEFMQETIPGFSECFAEFPEVYYYDATVVSKLQEKGTDSSAEEHQRP